MGDKSLIQIVDEVTSEICDKYCKYPELWDEEEEGCELCESNICKECPLRKLL